VKLSAKLSVVMSVFNGASDLERTLASIFAQTEEDFELIVVDDGSTDETPAILARQTDRRLRVITQANAGLTRALIVGCDAAVAPVIARHDCGDVSMPERFTSQLAALGDEKVILVSCWTRWIGPGGELMFVARADGDAVHDSLLHAGVDTIQGLTHHGTAMFRRNAYRAAGGYRDAFRFAQDLDLWIRFAQEGRIVVVPEVLYEATYGVGAISASRRSEQVALAAISIKLRDGRAMQPLLDEARSIGAKPRRSTPRDAARALYFIASCLRRNGDMRYKQYAREALRRNPLHLRSWLLLMR
jgi:glycosyltransferase involved in cell wall biosynthesis